MTPPGLRILIVLCPCCAQISPVTDEDGLDEFVAECDNCGECFRVERLGEGKVKTEKIEVS